jgi:hypothetical protein
MTPITSNPYIVGNPIKTRQMFFGREDDFQFVSRKIGEGRSNQIVVLCGERRSGKTSILFQIMGGKLGGGFLPILVDMQMLAGTKGDFEFFLAILKTGYAALENLGVAAPAAAALSQSSSVENLMGAFLAFVRQNAGGRTVLFLLDEYELIESKIKDGSLSESTVLYLAGVLEGSYPASFVFTGSTNLEDRNPAIWKTLLGKSVYRKISYLSQRDSVRLITEPLRDSVCYPQEVVESIFRLTGGQPFYTQVICQNLIDLLIDEERADPTMADLERIVRETVANPLPQMIYTWNSFPAWSRVMLSSLANIIEDASQWSGSRAILQFLWKSRILIPFKGERANVLLEDAYHREFLDKNDAEGYRFRMDVFRRWIRREHSIWKVVKEADIGFRRTLRALLVPASISAGALAVLAAAWLFLVPLLLPGLSAWGASAGLLPRGAAGPGMTEAASKDIRNVSFTANRGPFSVVIDGVYTHTAESELGSTWILVPSLAAGTHDFVATGPDGEELSLLNQEVTQTNNSFLFSFAPKELDPSQISRYVSPAQSSPDSLSQMQRSLELGHSVVVIVSEPPGASVQVFNGVVGVTPIALDVNAGYQVILLALQGYKPQNMSIATKAGKAYLQKTIMQANRTLLAFEGKARGSVLFDGQWLIDLPTVKTKQVPSGSHVITLLDPGNRELRRTAVDLVPATLFSVKDAP